MSWLKFGSLAFCTFASFAIAAVVACEPTSGNLTDTSPSAVTASDVEGDASPRESGVPSSSFIGGSSTTTMKSADCTNPPKASSASRRDQVCYRWRCEGRDVAPASWSGNASTCSPGTVDQDASARALRIVNLHRFVADVDPAVAISKWSEPAQRCALLAHANAKLSHEPPRDWACWSDVAALTSAVSLIANRSAAPAIGAFIEDPGNEATMVHRRWLLTENLTRIGIGTTDRYSCVIVDGTALFANDNDDEHDDTESSKARGWVAWPPKGPVPIEMLKVERVDEVGWTVQSSTGDLDSSSIKVTVVIDGGVAKPVHVSHLTPLYGSRSAIRFVPDGWSTEAGHTYSVTVKTATSTISYVVEPTAC